MISKIVTQQLNTAGLINEDEIEIVNYGIVHLIMNLVGVGTILIIGSVFEKSLEAFTMALAIFPLRKYAGGFHAESSRRCYLLSSGIVVLCFRVMNQICMKSSILIILSMCSILSILFLSPVECKNKRLDHLEKIEYKKRVFQVMSIEGIMVFLFYIFHFERSILGILMSWWIVAIAVLTGRITMYCSKC